MDLYNYYLGALLIIVGVEPLSKLSKIIGWYRVLSTPCGVFF